MVKGVKTFYWGGGKYGHCFGLQGSTLTFVCLSGTSVKKKYGQLNIAGHLYNWTSAILCNEVAKIKKRKFADKSICSLKS